MSSQNPTELSRKEVLAQRRKELAAFRERLKGLREKALKNQALSSGSRGLNKFSRSV